MPKFLLEASYVGEGVKGLLKEGGSSRRAAATKFVQSLGGSVEAFYYAFGAADAYIIIDVPDNVTAASLALTINASGLVRVKTTALMSVEEVDLAVKKSPTYRPPGQ